MKNISYMIFDYARREETKIGRKVHEWLKLDYLGGVILVNNNVFYIESNNDIPNYIYNYIVKFYKRQGYKFLYD